MSALDDTMAIEIASLPVPATADASKLAGFGIEVKGINPSELTPEPLKRIEQLPYNHDVLLFRDAFDPTSESYGRGNNKTEKTKKSILHPDLKTIPRQPQVQLIRYGTVYNHEGLLEAMLKHPSHTTFHKMQVTTLYGIKVPNGDQQICRYDEGTGDELEVPLGTTVFVSSKVMFDLLPPELKSLAVRSKVKYVHPYVLIAPTHAISAGLSIEMEGLELPLDQLPPWEESRRRTLPLFWRNPVTGSLHFEAHPCGAAELLVDPLSEGTNHEGVLYPDGVHITDLGTRPAIAPSLVYPHDWNEHDLVVFHNRRILHSVVGAFKPHQVRAFHQCNLAASDDPAGPTPEDVKKYA
ncbi:Clavaminate synthase-like protein [Laetiporus sulphureus 93-53]|uniref:Clavaminate synthase-like protein n=1 Tax=Laetiporus sulphureus 93-53 TaxID=1314785 RepID=A0A165C388_9APHY|nr:Clavaminate synthase-like protein [Laetiporus sulphureus 93-53]KZT02125.1 Clavaminate synthase-like protein [Laetiporus sulphureus 93-53]